ncbi:MAG: threonylcarbamoyl-AMP synthase [Oscillospiraceae bacterium]|jgi:L-threonylcarbamoyladenylate synthase|nr:threonylcarbamoyl-AMP synthase [Oscillospiraceae bacterium]
METKILKKCSRYKFYRKLRKITDFKVQVNALKLNYSLSDDINTTKISNILKSGDVAAIPTETVYGLAADIFSIQAIKKIFKAKGRPTDNPLIVHVSSLEQALSLVKIFPDSAQKLAAKFWPGPLTMILPKSNIVPFKVSAGLETVAIRFPFHKLAKAVITKTKTPLAAPSANLSGSPSPTSALHVLCDLNGKIPAILDGGKCQIGLESTVITLATNPPCLLRPGAVTQEQIESLIGRIDVHPSVNSFQSGFKAFSPGMKYKHYAPKAEVYLVKGDREAYINYVNSLLKTTTKNTPALNKSNITKSLNLPLRTESSLIGSNFNCKSDLEIKNSACLEQKLNCNMLSEIGALCYCGDEKDLNVFSISYGKCGDVISQCQELFGALREFDRHSIKKIYARCPEPVGVGAAVYNRLIRAACFQVIDLK